MAKTEFIVCLLDTSGKEHTLVVERDLPGPGAGHIIDQVPSMAKEAIETYVAAGVDVALVNYVYKNGAERTVYTVEATYPGDGGEFGDYVTAADEDDADFQVRWIMTDNNQLQSTPDGLEAFLDYMGRCRINDILRGTRVDPGQALNALYNALEAGDDDAIEKAKEDARTSLTQLGYIKEEEPAAPGMR
jgi:hypothetical protein